MFVVPESRALLHVYVVAPAAVSVDVDPLQMLVGDAVSVTVGNGVTATATLVVLEQLFASVPVTV